MLSSALVCLSAGYLNWCILMRQTGGLGAWRGWLGFEANLSGIKQCVCLWQKVTWAIMAESLHWA